MFRRVKQLQFVHDNSERPSVTENVMNCQEKNCVLSVVKELDAKHRASFQVERLLVSFANFRFELFFGPLARVDLFEADWPVRKHLLRRT